MTTKYGNTWFSSLVVNVIQIEAMKKHILPINWRNSIASK